MTAKNLAVIFRPALLSHPTHELSPHEHQLSQDVLEFLIAHQDWFMLDIPPPPTSSTGAGTVNSKTVAPVLTSGMSENVDIIPSSDDEVGGGWKLVDKDTSNHKVHRRRTMTERSGGRFLPFYVWVIIRPSESHEALCSPSRRGQEQNRSRRTCHCSRSSAITVSQPTEWGYSQPKSDTPFAKERGQQRWDLHDGR